MKQLFYSLVLTLLTISNSFGQKEITLYYNEKLGTDNNREIDL
jgi:hypothetical protein